jgi:hypothetical protein
MSSSSGRDFLFSASAGDFSHPRDRARSIEENSGGSTDPDPRFPRGGTLRDVFSRSPLGWEGPEPLNANLTLLAVTLPPETAKSGFSLPLVGRGDA